MTKEELYNLIYVEKLSYEEIGRRNSMTGAGIKKMALRLGIELPSRRKINSKEHFNKGVSEKLHPCLQCGKLTTNEKFCSHNCQQKYNYEKWISEWKEGKRTGIVGDYQIAEPLREYIFRKYNHRCARCGWSEINPYTRTLPLEVEHIDGDYTNNSEENLILLCPNCHSLTATYKGANKGHGRKGRSKYYIK